MLDIDLSSPRRPWLYVEERRAKKKPYRPANEKAALLSCGCIQSSAGGLFWKGKLWIDCFSCDSNSYFVRDPTINDYLNWIRRPDYTATQMILF